MNDGELFIKKEGTIKKFVNALQQITFSGKIALENKKEVIFITERAVFKLTEEGLKLTEIAPGVDIEKDIVPNMEFRPLIPETVKVMDSRIFVDRPMNLEF